ncbi:unnamed protein product [Cuscuta epithymum]|uniref:Uncharacterized protein n=1 Tax=Cuscuta epithymum TaxID=186058 RepID=A0AAV0F7U5_9ASTE|nr:unnamed protein product [Cuscuta epithymum]
MHVRPSPNDSRMHHQNVRRGSFPRRERGGPHQATSRSAAITIICRFCDNIGHEVKQCQKLQRFLRDYQVSVPATPSVNTTMTTPSSSQPWLFDSGASHHVTSDVSQLPTYADYGGPEEVQLGNGPSHEGASSSRGES